MTPIQMSVIHAEQKNDATMQFLIQQLPQGWPKYHKEVDPAINKYWTLRDDHSIEHGCIAYVGRLLIPPSLQNHGRKLLHRDHPGILRCVLGQNRAYTGKG